MLKRAHMTQWLVATATLLMLGVATSATADDRDDCGQEVNPDLSIRGCTSLIQRGYHPAIGYNNRGNAYAKKGDLDRAIADFDKAIQSNPNYADAYYNRGHAYNAKGDTDRAIADIDMAIQLNPDNAYRRQAPVMVATAEPPVIATVERADITARHPFGSIDHWSSPPVPVELARGMAARDISGQTSPIYPTAIVKTIDVLRPLRAEAVTTAVLSKNGGTIRDVTPLFAYAESIEITALDTMGLRLWIGNQSTRQRQYAVLTMPDFSQIPSLIEKPEIVYSAGFGDHGDQRLRSDRFSGTQAHQPAIIDLSSSARLALRNSKSVVRIPAVENSGATGIRTPEAEAAGLLTDGCCKANPQAASGSGDQNQLNEALQLSKQAVELSDKGNYTAAEPLHRRALAIREKVLGPEYPDTALSLNNLAKLLLERGASEEALSLFRRGAAAGFPDRSWFLLALSETMQDDPTEAFIVVQQTRQSAAASAISQLAARFASGSGPLSDRVRDEQDLTAKVARFDEAFLDILSKPPKERLPIADAEEKLRQDLDWSRQRLATIRGKLAADFPDYAELAKPSTFEVDEVQALLGDDEALVVIDTVDDGGGDYIWAVNRTGVEWHRLDTEEGEIVKIVSELRSGLNPQKDETVDPADAHELYELTLGRIAENIAGKSHLIFVINGAMTSLPPQVLVTADPKGKDLAGVDWLIKRHAVTVLPSVSSLQVFRGYGEIIGASQPIRAYADPVFSPEAGAGDTKLASRGYGAFYRGRLADVEALGKSLPRLEETAEEALVVAFSLGGAEFDVILGSNATETAIKNAKLDDYRVLYFATHALLAGEVEEYAKIGAEPALAFSIPETATELDDGLLTASEVAQLKLNADWVVLSGCNTAAGGKPGAEALSGLARAFFYAGARSLLVSHWPVESESAAALMITLFDNVATRPDQRPAEALRQAMLSVMHASDNPDWAKPAYWAPFILVGEPRG